MLGEVVLQLTDKNVKNHLCKTSYILDQMTWFVETNQVEMAVLNTTKLQKNINFLYIQYHIVMCFLLFRLPITLNWMTNGANLVLK